MPICRFARTGDPNTPGQPTWPEYKEKTDEHLTIDDLKLEVGRNLKKAKCDFWEKLWAAP